MHPIMRLFFVLMLLAVLPACHEKPAPPAEVSPTMVVVHATSYRDGGSLSAKIVCKTGCEATHSVYWQNRDSQTAGRTQGLYIGFHESGDSHLRPVRAEDLPLLENMINADASRVDSFYWDKVVEKIQGYLDIAAGPEQSGVEHDDE